MRLRPLFVSAAAVIAATALTATGCAGAGATGAPSLGGAAARVPADSVAFVAVDSDLSSGQWRATDGLLSKLPSHDALLAQLRQGLERRAKVSWEEDVRPALGPELDLVALPGSPPQLVALTQPSDPAKLHALLAKLGNGIESRQVGAWTAISKSAAALDSLEHVTAPLADTTAYQDATAKLAGDALVRAYVDGAQAQRLLASLPGQVAARTPPLRPRYRGFRGSGTNVRAFVPERFAWGAADVVAVDDGLRVRAFTHAAPASEVAVSHARLLQLRTRPYTSVLVDEIPADALLVADYQASTTGFEEAAPSLLPPWLRALRTKVPSLPTDLETLLGGETAVYVRPGLPLPELTLVTQPADVGQAVGLLPSVLSELKAAFPMLAQVSVRHAVVGGQLVLSTSEQGISAFRSPGAKLSADPMFREATKAADMPQQTTGFAYANLKEALPLLSALAPRAGLGDDEALRSLTAYGTRSGADSSYTLFLEVE
jgi:hypothetical protein